MASTSGREHSAPAAELLGSVRAPHLGNILCVHLMSVQTQVSAAFTSISCHTGGSKASRQACGVTGKHHIQRNALLPIVTDARALQAGECL